MPGPRQPTDLIVAKGKKHLSKAEEVERRRREPKEETPKTAKPPKWMKELPDAEQIKKDFRRIGKQLIAAGIYTDLDADTLGRYLVAHYGWLRATQYAQAELEARNLKGAEDWERKQDRYFKQAQSCAKSLGLSVVDRCRLAVPESTKQETEDSNPFLRVIQGGFARNA